MDLKLSFAKTAYSLLDQSSDHVALKKLCTYLLEELEKNYQVNTKYAELLIKNDNLIKGQAHLEKELINYKLKFEEISKNLSRYENAIRVNVNIFDDETKEVSVDYPVSQTEANEIAVSNPAYDGYIPFVSHQEKAEEFAFMLKDHLKSNLIGNQFYYEEFKKVKPTIELFTSNMIKNNKKEWREGKQMPTIKPGKTSMGFAHILPQNKEDSIFLVTSSNQKNNTNYHLIPQTVVENMLKLGDAKASKYPQYIMKEIKELVEFSIVKIGVKKYWLGSIVTMINSLKEIYLKSQHLKLENTQTLNKLKEK
jgi:hypothetical protein